MDLVLAAIGQVLGAWLNPCLGNMVLRSVGFCPRIKQSTPSFGIARCYFILHGQSTSEKEISKGFVGSLTVTGNEVEGISFVMAAQVVVQVLLWTPDEDCCGWVLGH